MTFEWRTEWPPPAPYTRECAEADDNDRIQVVDARHEAGLVKDRSPRHS
jgi:hypothetical protein